jgi:hypothetical protein
MAVALISIVGIIVPRLKYSIPSSGPSASETPRAEQATLEAVANSMFQMTDLGGESDDPKEVTSDRLDYEHMLQGKEMTPEEQRPAAPLWTNQRSAVIFAYLRKRLTKSAGITANNTAGDSAVVSAAAKIYPHESSEWTDGVCQKFKQKMGPRPEASPKPVCGEQSLVECRLSVCAGAIKLAPSLPG